MKKLLRIVLACCIFSSPHIAHAEGAYFGVGGQLVSFVPVPEIQVGYDFDSASSGFGVKVSLASLLLLNQVDVDGYYRFERNDTGANMYVGAGGGGRLILAIGADGGVFTTWNVHGLLGVMNPIAPKLAWFSELRIGAEFLPEVYIPSFQISPAGTSFYAHATVGLISLFDDWLRQAAYCHLEPHMSSLYWRCSRLPSTSRAQPTVLNK
jgi:hypothetical protein